MKLPQDSIPTTFDEAIQVMAAALSEDERHTVCTTAPESHHFFAAMALRNEWSLWEDTPLTRDIKRRSGLWGHGDDISGLLMQGLWCRVRGRPFNIEEAASKYRAHWISMGVDPATGKEVG